MKKKIAFVIPGLDSGGAERVVSTLANELSNLYDITIITLWDVDPFYPLNRNVKHIKCTSKPLISNHIFQAIQNNIFLLKRLKAIFKTQKIDLVIAFTTTANILAIMAAKSQKIPSIISERSNPNFYIPNRLWRYLRKITYKKADFLVLQTIENLNYFKRFIIDRKLIVLPNPLSSELVRNKKHDSTKENIILNVGRLDKNKSQDLLIRAFGNLDTVGWRLVFIGEGEERNTYEDLVRSLNLESKVSFEGNSNTVHDYYNSAKIFAFTSQSEGFPNVLIEAMFFELSCISTNCPSGPSEIIDDGINGFLVPVNDQITLEKKLRLLMSSEKIRNKFGNNAYESVQRYRIKSIVELWDKIIKNLIN